MRISCHNCHRIWEVSAGNMRAAKLKFGLGAHEHSFVCPNCQAKNVVSKADFDTYDAQIPVTGAPLGVTKQNHPARADNDPASPPINPIPGPDPNSSQIHAIVRQNGLRLLREHNPTAETMGNIKGGEHIIILDTWMDGKDIWIQLGPERWATIQDNGEPLLDLLDE